jgi:hypothetical protein
VDEERNGEEGPRAPTHSDLALIAASLDRENARYAVIGGFAIIHHGYLRTTADIDLLIDPSIDNVERVRRALSVLHDKAVLEVRLTDLETYTVVRVADEVVVDLMAKACGVTLAEIEANVVIGEIDGVSVRYASAADLLRTKQTLRPKDAVDRLFLEEILREDR